MSNYGCAYHVGYSGRPDLQALRDPSTTKPSRRLHAPTILSTTRPFPTQQLRPHPHHLLQIHPLQLPTTQQLPPPKHNPRSPLPLHRQAPIRTRLHLQPHRKPLPRVIPHNRHNRRLLVDAAARDLVLRYRLLRRLCTRCKPSRTNVFPMPTPPSPPPRQQAPYTF